MHIVHINSRHFELVILIFIYTAIQELVLFPVICVIIKMMQCLGYYNMYNIIFINLFFLRKQKLFISLDPSSDRFNNNSLWIKNIDNQEPINNGFAKRLYVITKPS